MTVPPWQIRRARGAELVAARRLMPAAFTAMTAPDEVHLAWAGDAAIGAVATAWLGWGEPPGFPVLVEVAPGWRRRGLGRALLAAAAASARGETERFHAWLGIAEGGEEAGFLRAAGFSVSRRTLHFEAEGSVFYAMVEALHRRLAASGRIPDGARIVPLAAAEPAAVARLVGDAFVGSRYGATLANARGEAMAGWDRERSAVLTIDGAVRGALLYRWAGATPEIDVNVVAPELRRGWANVALLEAATRAGLAGGARRFRFHCEDTVRDTMNLARRSGAEQRRVELEFSAPLGALLG